MAALFQPGPHWLAALAVEHSAARAWPYWLFVLCLVFLAYWTNPNEASFRSYLTDVSFQQHLRKLRSAPKSGTGKMGDSHILTFSNHISISLRTPPYTLHSWGLFSIVTMISAPGVRDSAVRESLDTTLSPEEGGISTFKARQTFFLGAFGKWWTLDDSEENTALAVKDRLANNVMAMDSNDLKVVPDGGEQSPTYHEIDELTLPGELKQTNASRKHGTPIKATFRAGQRRASYRLHTKTKIVTPTSDRPPVSPVPDAAISSSCESVPSTQQTHADSPKLGDGFIDEPAESAAEAQIAVLQVQLDELEASSNATRAQLSAELEELRTRKRDEEQARTEMKTRIRSLEEAKRLAEHSHSQSERRLGVARQHKHAAADKIEKLKAEIARLERKDAELVEKSRRHHEEQLAQEKKLKADIEARTEALRTEEEKTRQLMSRVETMEREIDDRKAERMRRQFSYLYPTSSRTSLNSMHLSHQNQAVPAQWAAYRSPDGAHVLPANASSNMHHVPRAGYSPESISPVPANGFLEHRMQHHRRETASSESLPDYFPSTFAPFGPTPPRSVGNSPLLPQSSVMSSGVTAPAPAPVGSGRNVSLPFFMHGSLTSLTGDVGPAVQDGFSDPMLSPMTPNQTSLIPSRLFSMLDEDDELPPSPTVETKRPNGLGLAHPEDAEYAFKHPASLRSRSGSASSKTPGLPILSQQNLRDEDDDLLKPASRQQMLHALSLNPAAEAFSFGRTLPQTPLDLEPLEAEKKKGLLSDLWAKTSKSSK